MRYSFLNWNRIAVYEVRTRIVRRFASPRHRHRLNFYAIIKASITYPRHLLINVTLSKIIKFYLEWNNRQRCRTLRSIPDSFIDVFAGSSNVLCETEFHIFNNFKWVCFSLIVEQRFNANKSFVMCTIGGMEYFRLSCVRHFGLVCLRIRLLCGVPLVIEFRVFYGPSG